MNGIQALTTPMRPGSVGNTPKGTGPAVVPEPLKNLVGLMDFLTTSSPSPQGQATPPVAAQVAQAAAEKMGMGAPAVGDVVETAVPAMAAKQMEEQAAMQQMAQQMTARGRRPAGITSLDPDIVPLKEGGIIGYAGPEGSFVNAVTGKRGGRYLEGMSQQEIMELYRREKERQSLEEERARNMALIANEGFTRPAMVNDPRLIRATPQADEQQVIGAPALPSPPPQEKRGGEGIATSRAAPRVAPTAPAAPAAPATDENPFMQMILDQLKAGLGAKAPTFDETQAARAQARKAAGVPEGPAGQATEQGITALRGALQKVLSAGQMTPQEQAWEKFHRFAAGAQGAGTAGGALSGGTRGVMSLEAAQRKGERDKAMLEYNLEKLVIDMQNDVEKARRAEAEGDYAAYKDAMNAYATKQNQLNNLLGTAATAKESSLTRKQVAKDAAEARREAAASRAAMAKKSPTELAFDYALKKHKGDALAAFQEVQGIARPGKQEDLYGAYLEWRKANPQVMGLPEAQAIQQFMTSRSMISAPADVRAAMAAYGPK